MNKKKRVLWREMRDATGILRLVLHVAVTSHWNIKQLDVKNAFLHGDLKETVYMIQPPGFADPHKSDYVCKLKKAIYGLKQAPRAWFDKFSSYLLNFGFICSIADPSLFVYAKNGDLIYLLLYVDDIVLTGNNDALIQKLLTSLSAEFRMKDMGALKYFLGVQAYFHTDGLFLNQSKYAQDLLVSAGMSECAPVSTPLPLQIDRVSGQDKDFADPTYFRSLAGKLQYLTWTRPDLQFAVNLVCQRMHSPSEADFFLLKRILRYVKGTTQMGINITADTDSILRAYSDSDWAGCKETRRSTGGCCVFLGHNIISWSAKRHPTVSKSSTEAEYRTLSLAASELKWITSLMKSLGLSQQQVPELYCDNLSAVYLTANPALHSRSKHFDVDFHYVRERVAHGDLIVKHISAQQQIADVFTKSLAQEPFVDLRYKLGVSGPPTPSLRGCINNNMKISSDSEALDHSTFTVGLSKHKPNYNSSSSTYTCSTQSYLRDHTPAGESSVISLHNQFSILGSCVDV